MDPVSVEFFDKHSPPAVKGWRPLLVRKPRIALSKLIVKALDSVPWKLSRWIPRSERNNVFFGFTVFPRGIEYAIGSLFNCATVEYLAKCMLLRHILGFCFT